MILVSKQVKRYLATGTPRTLDAFGSEATPDGPQASDSDLDLDLDLVMAADTVEI